MAGAWLVASIALPLAGTPLIALAGRRTRLRETVTLVTSGLLFLVVLRLLLGETAGTVAGVTLAEPLPGLALALALEPLGLLFALVAAFLWCVTSVYAIGYMRAHHEPHQTRFYAFFALALASTMGIAFAANMFTLFVFYEALTFATYPLVTHSGTAEARRAGRVYLGLLLSTSVGLLLPAMVWTWLLAGTLDFRPGGVLAGVATPGTVGVLYALYVLGVGKAALMPLHRWLPAAMVAPTPVSALLHAVAVVKAGVFTILKVTVYLFGTDLLAEAGAGRWLIYLALFGIFAASIVALTRDNLKARLAYSTVSQLGYIVMGALLVNTAGVVAGAVHLVMHAFAKITLFFCAGAILVSSGKTRASELAGIGRRMPWTMAAFAVASVSMIGLPPTAGFISKWYLLMATVEAAHYPAIAVLVLSSMLNAGYFLPIVYAAFFRPPHESGSEDVEEAPLLMLLALWVPVTVTLGLFFFPDLPLALARRPFGEAP